MLYTIAAALPSGIVRLHSSPLQRCLHFAEALGASLGLDVETDDRLREIDFGRWEMQAWAVVPRAEIDQWAADVADARPHGGESVSQMTVRVRDYLRDVASTKEDTLAVTHQGVARCVAAVLAWPDPYSLKLNFGDFLTIESKDIA